MLRKMFMFLSIVSLAIISAQAATVSGLVKNADSTAAIDSAIVTLRQQGAGGVTRLDTTDATGAFSFTTSTLATYTITAAKVGYNVLPNANITVADTSVTYSHNLYLVKTVYGSVTGTVMDSVTPTTAVVGAKVYLRASNFGGAISDSTTTDAAGKYILSNIAARTAAYYLSFSATGYVARNNLAVTIANATPVTDDITLLKIVYGSITGAVTDSAAATTTPVVGAKVYLRSGTTGGATNLDSATTDAAGAYTIAHVQAGIARALRVQMTGYITKNVSNVTVVDASALTENIALVKIVTGSIVGTVTDSLATTAITGAKVYLRSGNTNVDSMVTAADGKFTFSSVSSGSTYSLTVSATGFIGRNNISVLVSGATPTTADVKLLKIVIGSITGTITDSVATTAIAGAKVLLRTTGGGARTIDSAVTLADGKYTLDSITSGTAYTLSISAAGFNTRTGVSVTVTSATPLTMDVKLVKILYGSITGTVSDSTAATATIIAGAKVYLLAANGRGVAYDSAVTDSTGKYTLANAPIQTTAYSMSVSASGYYARTGLAVTVSNATPVVRDVKLVKIVYGSITGTVTDSLAATATPIVGAKVSLRTGGVLDSAITGADGTYTLSNVETQTAPYTVTVSATGYTARNVQVTVPTATAVTQNIKLITVPKGSIFVFVKKTADSSAIAAASLTMSIGGVPTTVVAGTDGVASFVDIATANNYAITATADGFVAGSATTTLARDQKDTVKIYLSAATGGAKVLTGIVKDSTTKAVLAHVDVVLTLTTGATTLTLHDSTDATGKFTITNIPLNRTTGRVTITLAGYTNYRNNSGFSDTTNLADTTTLNISLIPVTATLVSGKKSLIAGTPELGFSAGQLRLRNFADAGIVNLFNVNGKLLYRGSFGAQTASFALPKSVAKSGNAYILSVTQNNAVYRKQIIMP